MFQRNIVRSPPISRPRAGGGTARVGYKEIAMALRHDPAFILRWFVLVGAVVIGGGLPACSGSGGTASVVNPTPVPSNPVASPNPMTFTNAGAAFNQTLTVTEANYSGMFTAVSQNTGVVTVAAGAQPNTFTVTPVAAGQTTIVVTDTGNRTTSVTVTVTITPVTVT